MEPSKTLAAAMKASDVIIITTNLEWANRFAHVNPVAESVVQGAKIGSVEEGMADWDLTYEDIDLIVSRAEKLIAAMEGAEWCRVTTPAGTDVRVCIKDRPALKVVPVKGAGEMMGPVPLWGEVAYAAVEDKTEGVIVVDGIMLGVGVPGTLAEPIRWEIREGRAVSITGGPEADLLRAVIEGSDEMADVVAEYAIGTSHKSKLGSPSEKGMMGTVHFALGDNSHCYPGGCSHSKLHLDRSVRQVTIEVDGKLVMKDGSLVV
jgi:leucyl aminopeptidase (aminopeptidase T)